MQLLIVLCFLCFLSFSCIGWFCNETIHSRAYATDIWSFTRWSCCHKAWGGCCNSWSGGTEHRVCFYFYSLGIFSPLFWCVYDRKDLTEWPCNFFYDILVFFFILNIQITRFLFCHNLMFWIVVHFYKDFILSVYDYSWTLYSNALFLLVQLWGIMKYENFAYMSSVGLCTVM